MDFSTAPITFSLIAINVILSLLGFSNRALLDKMIMWPYGVKRHNQYYRFITSGFIHQDGLHLAFNMISLFYLGPIVEQYYSQYELGGNASYLFLYFLGLVISDFPSYLKHQDNYNYA